MKTIFFFILVSLCSLNCFSIDEDPLLARASVQPFDWSPGQSGELTVNLQLPKGYHAYIEKFKLTLMEPDGFSVGKPQISPVIDFFDKSSNKNRKSIDQKASLKVVLEAPTQFIKNSEKMIFELEYQACTETFCLFPTTKKIEVPIRLAFVEAQLLPPSSASESVFDENSIAKKLNENAALAFLIVFIAGILTCFTPCIFPMIPITLAVLGHGSEKRSRAQNFYLSLSYVHGIATTYSILGVIAASSGAVFGASLQSKWVLGFICLLFFTMAMSMYGFFDLQVPAIIRNKLGGGKKQVGYFGAYLSGLAAGIVASPCVGPVLIAILTYVATTGNRIYGFFLLFTYAMGLGLIFLILGAFTELTRKLPRSGPWMDSMKLILGSLMMGAVYYYLALLVEARVHDALLGVGLVTLSSYFGAFSAQGHLGPIKRIRKGLLQATMLIGVGYLILGVFNLRPLITENAGASQLSSTMKWLPYSDSTLQEALGIGKPVVIDFRADWCGACLELEDQVFTNDRIEALSQNFTLIKFDATKDSVEFKTLQSRYRIKGLPHMVFYDKSGKLLQDMTLNQFEAPEKFQQRLEKVLNKPIH